jgi:fatty acid synthase
LLFYDGKKCNLFWNCYFLFIFPPGLYGLPKRTGKLKDLVHFDATFFGVHAKQAHVMDPQLRILLELTHEALIDAGMCCYS